MPYKDPEKRREKDKLWYQKNREHKLNYAYRYRREHLEHRRYYEQKYREEHRLNNNMYWAIRKTLKNKKNNKSWENLVGYTVNDLKNHLEQTLPEGYTWQDYLDGKLHIDHILPQKLFVYNSPEDEDFKLCWSLDNLQLLPAEENISKKDSITNPILLGLLLAAK
jgi:hypothetical protein